MKGLIKGYAREKKARCVTFFSKHDPRRFVGSADSVEDPYPEIFARENQPREARNVKDKRLERFKTAAALVTDHLLRYTDAQTCPD